MKTFIKNIVSKKIECDVLVVGGGPAGSGAALMAAKNGARTILIDKKLAIGTPIECGECIGSSLLKKFGINLPQNIIRYKHDGTAFYINKEIKVENRSPQWKSISVDRRDLDKFLLYKAADAGAYVLVGAKLRDAEVEEDNTISLTIIETEKREIYIKPKVIVAADGTFSTLRKIQECRKLKGYEIGRTVSYEITNIKLENPKMVQMFFDDLTKDGYGYIIPLSDNSANVGLGRIGINRFPWEELEIFLAEHPLVTPQIENGRIIEIKKGETAITGMKLELKVGNVLYAGDAAGQNLSHVGEGAIPSHICGRIAGEIAAKAARSNDLSILDKYPEAIMNSDIGLELKMCEEIRDEVLKIWTSTLSIEKKCLLGGLLTSEVVPPSEKEKILTMLNRKDKKDISQCILDYLNNIVNKHIKIGII
mgnify:CR=1 FL=1